MDRPQPAIRVGGVAQQRRTYSLPIAATVGLTTQFTVLAGGNPLSYAVVNGPPTLSINSQTGVVTYTPGPKDVGNVSVVFRIYNALGSVTQTVQFNVAAPNPRLAKPKLKLTGTALVYSGLHVGVSAIAVGADGITPVAGTFAFAYDGSSGIPTNAGTYGVLATFTSADPKYANATFLGTLTISKATPVLTALISQTFAIGTSSATFTGSIAAGYYASPVNDSVIVTLDGMAETAVVDANGNFSTTFAIGTLPLGSYTVSYAFAGDSNYNAALTGYSKLTIIPTAPPKVTLNPMDVTVSAGDGATFTAAASGSNPPAVQWQVSTDGGKTFTDIYSPGGDTLSFATNAGQDGYLYRAVFTNSTGVAITSAARLTIQTDTGGGD